MTDGPVPFEIYGDGETYLHGTKATLNVGDVLSPGFESNFRPGDPLRHVYMTQTLDAATWGAELAVGDGPGRIYLVEPTGEIEDDPNVTDKRFPGNPTRSYRTLDPVRVVGEVLGWVGHAPEQVATMRAGLAALEGRGENVIED